MPPKSATTNKKYIEGLGRRKRSIARARLNKNGSGKFSCDGKEIVTPEAEWLEPFTAVGLNNQFDVTLIITGGGLTGRKEAARLAISRALIKYDESLKKALRQLGYLTRDPREKERKKPGLKRARRAPQWSKR